MRNYVITFTGRNKNAIGIFYKITATRQGETFEDAVLALYDEFDHISFPKDISEQEENKT